MSSADIDSEMFERDQVSLDDANPNPKAMKLFRFGQKLNETQVKIYQDLFASAKEVNPALAVLLLGCYYQQSKDSNSSFSLNDFAALLKWFIEKHPSSFLVWTAIYPKDDENFRNLKNAWLCQCDETQTNISVLNNAAHFCNQLSDDLSEVFWKRAKELDSSAIWLYELACLYKKRVVCTADLNQKKSFAEQALREFGDAQCRPNDYPEKSYLSETLLQDAIKQFRQLACDFGLEYPEPH